MLLACRTAELALELGLGDATADELTSSCASALLPTPRAAGPTGSTAGGAGLAEKEACRITQRAEGDTDTARDRRRHIEEDAAESWWWRTLWGARAHKVHTQEPEKPDRWNSVAAREQSAGQVEQVLAEFLTAAAKEDKGKGEGEGVQVQYSGRAHWTTSLAPAVAAHLVAQKGGAPASLSDGTILCPVCGTQQTFLSAPGFQTQAEAGPVLPSRTEQEECSCVRHPVPARLRFSRLPSPERDIDLVDAGVHSFADMSVGVSGSCLLHTGDVYDSIEGQGLRSESLKLYEDLSAQLLQLLEGVTETTYGDETPGDEPEKIESEHESPAEWPLSQEEAAWSIPIDTSQGGEFPPDHRCVLSRLCLLCSEDVGKGKEG